MKTVEDLAYALAAQVHFQYPPSSGCSPGCVVEIGAIVKTLLPKLQEYDAEVKQALSELKEELDIKRNELIVAWGDCTDGTCRACPKCCDALAVQLKRARQALVRVGGFLSERARVATGPVTKND